MSSEPPAYIEARIQQRLADDPRVAMLGVRATVQPPNVFLRGEVPSEERRGRAGEVVREMLPAFEIFNEIVVTGAHEPEAREELR